MKKIEKFEYYGIFLSEESKKVLKDFLDESWSYRTALSHSEKQYVHHCTVLHKTAAYKSDILNYCESCLGIELAGKVVAVGYNDQAMAFKVEFPGVPMVNRIPHITIATFDGGKPVDSNKIDVWDMLPNPIEVIGRLGAFTSNGIDYGE